MARIIVAAIVDACVPFTEAMMIPRSADEACIIELAGAENSAEGMAGPRKMPADEMAFTFGAAITTVIASECIARNGCASGCDGCNRDRDFV